MGKNKLVTKTKQSQKGLLSPSSKLFIKLINLNLIQLGELIDKELAENPCIEELLKIDSSKEEINVSSKLSNIQNDSLGFNENIIEDRTLTFADYLLRQLGYFKLDKEDKKIIFSLIQLIDDDGFLSYTNDEIITIIEEKNKLHINEIKIEESILWCQRNFDPTGIFSRSTVESLLVQLELKNNQNLSFYREIISNYLEELASGEFNLIAKELNIDLEIVESCLDAISELEPRPARNFIKEQDGRFDTEPEAFILEDNSKLRVHINKNFRNFEVSSYYENMLKRNTDLDKDVKEYIKDKIEKGKTLIKTIEERNEIYARVLNTIVDIQKDFIRKGDQYLKPLKLSDIASIVDTHESTISRITSNKYVGTPRGTINMKSFFSNKVESKDDKSSVAVKDIINEIIENEEKINPLSDETVKEILAAKDVKISRRTVAKYRKMLKIPSSFKRRL
ncbi:MAG: RNA polymerase factor sigma-54 [Thermodesulfobacteriota bacterium]|nr:RNA polymerase factor sigma-54 [Thermodesulfobacteriota bacterium]